jgi:hypothetical protein
MNIYMNFKSDKLRELSAEESFMGFAQKGTY